MRLLFSFIVFRRSEMDNVNGLIGLFVLGAQRLALQTRLDQLVLQPPEGAEVGGDQVQNLHHPVAQLGFQRRDRHAAAVVEVVVVLVVGFRLLFRRRFFLGLVFLALGLFGAGDGRRVQHAIGRVKVDDLAQQDAVCSPARRATP